VDGAAARRRVGRDQSFFALGGDSLLGDPPRRPAAGGRAAGASLRGLFAAPTVAGFAAQLNPGCRRCAGPALEADLAVATTRSRPTEVQRAYWLGAATTRLGRRRPVVLEFEGA